MVYTVHLRCHFHNESIFLEHCNYAPQTETPGLMMTMEEALVTVQNVTNSLQQLTNASDGEGKGIDGRTMASIHLHKSSFAFS